MINIKKFLWKEFYLPMQEGWILPVREWFAIRKDLRKLKRAKRLADYLSERQNGRKYVIMKNAYGQWQPFCKNDFKKMRLKSHGVFDPKCTWEDILRDCTYQTKSNNDKV